MGSCTLYFCVSLAASSYSTSNTYSLWTDRRYRKRHASTSFRKKESTLRAVALKPHTPLHYIRLLPTSCSRNDFENRDQLEKMGVNVAQQLLPVRSTPQNRSLWLRGIYGRSSVEGNTASTQQACSDNREKPILFVGGGAEPHS